MPRPIFKDWVLFSLDSNFTKKRYRGWTEVKRSFHDNTPCLRRETCRLYNYSFCSPIRLCQALFRQSTKTNAQSSTKDKTAHWYAMHTAALFFSFLQKTWPVSFIVSSGIVCDERRSCSESHVHFSKATSMWSARVSSEDSMLICLLPPTGPFPKIVYVPAKHKFSRIRLKNIVGDCLLSQSYCSPIISRQQYQTTQTTIFQDMPFSVILSLREYAGVTQNRDWLRRHPFEPRSDKKHKQQGYLHKCRVMAHDALPPPTFNVAEKSRSQSPHPCFTSVWSGCLSQVWLFFSYEWLNWHRHSEIYFSFPLTATVLTLAKSFRQFNKWRALTSPIGQHHSFEIPEPDLDALATHFVHVFQTIFSRLVLSVKITLDPTSYPRERKSFKWQACMMCRTCSCGDIFAELCLVVSSYGKQTP